MVRLGFRQIPPFRHIFCMLLGASRGRMKKKMVLPVPHARIHLPPDHAPCEIVNYWVSVGFLAHHYGSCIRPPHQQAVPAAATLLIWPWWDNCCPSAAFPCPSIKSYASKPRHLPPPMATSRFPLPATKTALGLHKEKHDAAAQAASKDGMQRFPGTGAPHHREPEAERAKQQKYTCPDPCEHPIPSCIPDRVLGSYKHPFSLT